VNQRGILGGKEAKEVTQHILPVGHKLFREEGWKERKNVFRKGGEVRKEGEVVLPEDERLPRAAAQLAWTSTFGDSMSRSSTAQMLVPSMRTFT